MIISTSSGTRQRHGVLLGPKIRRQRRRLGLTLDELAGRTSISKPYLSLIETGRVANPPSDEKTPSVGAVAWLSPAGNCCRKRFPAAAASGCRAVLNRLMADGGGRGEEKDAEGEGRGDAETQGTRRAGGHGDAGTHGDAGGGGLYSGNF